VDEVACCAARRTWRSAGLADEAIAETQVAEEHARPAVGATPEGSPDRAHYLNNRAMWVTDRWERTGGPAALDSAIDLLSRALAAAR
jgi:hypothetical protein